MSPVIASRQSHPAEPPAPAPPPSRAPAPTPGPRPFAEGGRARPVRTRSRRAGASIARKELPGFSRQMAAMLSAGMPIVTSLETVEEQATNPLFRAAIVEIRHNIENGMSFSESIAHMPGIFDELYVNMTRAGERSGQFAETMRRIADLLEATARLRRRVKSAMTYPIVVLCLALAIASGMILFIVPVFSGMYADFGAKLPGPTQFLVDLSGAAKRYSPIIVPVIIALVFLFRRWRRTPSGAFTMDRLALRAPVFGVLAQKLAIARLARTLAQMLSSGVPILGSLEIAAKACGNRVVARSVMAARETVERGDPLSVALVNRQAIPMLLVRMLAAGEKTGKVDEMMINIAESYDSEIEAMLASLTSLLEPVLMIFLGITIGGIVICMFLPIFKMSEVINM